METAETRRVRIQRLALADLDATFEAALESIPETFPWMDWCHPGLTRTELSEFLLSLDQAWQQDKAYTFSIFDAGTGMYLGAGGVNRIDRMYQMGNLHYWVRTSSVGKGVATYAAKQVAAFGFRDLGLQRIEIVVPAGNLPSSRVAEKLGALKEGVLRNRVRLHGMQLNATMYCLLSPDGGAYAAA
jgi:RimJ/RimL family protein N-acetyltransferase